MQEHNQSPPSHLRWGRGGREGAKSLKNLRVKKFQPNIIFQLKPCFNTLLWWPEDCAGGENNNYDNIMRIMTMMTIMIMTGRRYGKYH